MEHARVNLSRSADQAGSRYAQGDGCTEHDGVGCTGHYTHAQCAQTEQCFEETPVPRYRGESSERGDYIISLLALNMYTFEGELTQTPLLSLVR
jgi:hypothetical protein